MSVQFVIERAVENTVECKSRRPWSATKRFLNSTGVLENRRIVRLDRLEPLDTSHLAIHRSIEERRVSSIVEPLADDRGEV